MVGFAINCAKSGDFAQLGNTILDKLSGRDLIETTTLKLRCIGCTVMVFNESDIKLFKDISVGYRFSAIVKEWKEKVYHFKKLTNDGIVKESLLNLDEKHINLNKYRTYLNDENDWLQDAAGDDDPETMNDAYWNMD